MSELIKLENLLKQGRITRREFLARVSALGLTVALSPTLFSTPVKASTPKKGGRLKVGSSGAMTTDTLDTRDPSTDLMTLFINSQLMNSLIEINYKNETVPELAESWEPTPDAKKWIIKLRKGVEFHNSKTMDAEDVIYSFNLHRGEDTKSGAKEYLKAVKEIKADGKYTVVFTLEGGNADFPSILSDFHFHIVPNGTTDFSKGIGTGGYILESFEPGVRSFTKRNPNYWKEGRAHFDEVETIGINDVVARSNALRTGEVDVINDCDAKTFHLLEKSPGIQGLNVPGKKHFSFALRTDMAPYENNDVRLALKYAIDRKHLLKVIVNNYGTIGNDHPISPAYRYFDAELPQREYDPDKAKYYIKKAGLEGNTFKFYVSNVTHPGTIDAAILYKEHAAKAGINIEVIRVPDDGYWGDVWMKKSWFVTVWWGRMTEDMIFSLVYSLGAPWNETFWEHTKFNKLLKAARPELDDAKRREIYAEMQKIIRDEGGSIIPLFANDLHAATTKLKFKNVASNFQFDGLKLAERWWFES